MEYFTWAISVPVFMSYMYSLFKKDIHFMVLRTIWIIAGLFGLLVLVLPIAMATELVPPYRLVTVLSIFYGAALVGKLVWLKRDGSILLGLGCVFLFASALSDILFAIFTLDVDSMIHLGLLVFVLIQSLLVSMRSSEALQLVEAQSILS